MGGGTIVKEGYLIKSPPLNSKGVKVSQLAIRPENSLVAIEHW